MILFVAARLINDIRYLLLIMKPFWIEAMQKLDGHEDDWGTYPPHLTYGYISHNGHVLDQLNLL